MFGLQCLVALTLALFCLFVCQFPVSRIKIAELVANVFALPAAQLRSHKSADCASDGGALANSFSWSNDAPLLTPLVASN